MKAQAGSTTERPFDHFMEKRYPFAQAERQMQDLWEQEKLYQFDETAPGTLYTIDTPPPTVSGNLHIGHLFSYTQGEIIARFHRMQGENVFYPFGFDDNGLPTERLVEREKGIRANALPPGEFISHCRQIAHQYEETFQAFWNSLGFSVDWSVSYQTSSPTVQKISQALFLELVEKGKAYVKESPVLWCTQCQTSIAQAELDAVEVESTFNEIPFLVEGKPLLVATTRPELLFGCTCLFVNPEDERYRDYVGKSALVPLYDREIPILADEKVDQEKGTGAVMCATFGDTTDMEWYSQYQLPYRKVILPDGTIAPQVPFIGGYSVPAARKEIIRLLWEKGLLSRSTPITHTISTHERCGTPVEIIPSKQWYIDILSEKERFLKAADQIQWHPASMKSRYIAWVENLKWDWCISRQRYFGVPLPLWYCKDCGKPVFPLPSQLPINPPETAYQGSCSSCGCREFLPESAVLDTWATSSITPQINQWLGLPLLPMSMRTHAHEIIRTWTFYTIVRSLYHTGKLPWKDLMICGFVLAKKGEKISKSKGNNRYEPTQLIQQHSADALRYWTAGAKLGTDTFFDIDELSSAKRFLTKLWNASKFAISHLQDFSATETPSLLPIDQWILARTNETMLKATDLLHAYEIGPARHEIDQLFWKDFCDNYIELVKERLYLPEVHGAEARRSGQYALYHGLLGILKLYAIYVPHITDYIYRSFFQKHEAPSSIHATQWENAPEADPTLLSLGEKLEEILAQVRKYKSEHNLSMKAQISPLHIPAPPPLLPLLRQSEKDLLACTHAEGILFHEDNSLPTSI